MRQTTPDLVWLRTAAILVLSSISAVAGSASCRQGQVEMLIGGARGAQCGGELRTSGKLRSPSAEENTAAPRIGAAVQRQRDEERLDILRRELSAEQQVLEHLQAAAQPDAAAMSRSQANLRALQREIDRLLVR